MADHSYQVQIPSQKERIRKLVGLNWTDEQILSNSLRHPVRDVGKCEESTKELASLF